MKAWKIREWRERYEVNSRNHEAHNGDPLRRGPLPWVRLKVNGRQHGQGYRRLVQVARTPARLEAAMALWPKLLEIAADNVADRRGWILNEQDRPATVDDLAFYTGFRAATVRTAIEVLTAPGVRWVCADEFPQDSGEIPGNPGKAGEIPPSDSDSDTDTDTYPPLPPQGGREQKRDAPQQPQETTDDPDFTAFWAAYPRKIGKGAARKAWRKATGLPKVEVLTDAIHRASLSDDWRREGGRFIPHPATWLNQERWLDETGPPADAGDAYAAALAAQTRERAEP